MVKYAHTVAYTGHSGSQNQGEGYLRKGFCRKWRMLVGDGWESNLNAFYTAIEMLKKSYFSKKISLSFFLIIQLASSVKNFVPVVFLQHVFAETWAKVVNMIEMQYPFLEFFFIFCFKSHFPAEGRQIMV